MLYFVISNSLSLHLNTENICLINNILQQTFWITIKNLLHLKFPQIIRFSVYSPKCMFYVLDEEFLLVLQTPSQSSLRHSFSDFKVENTRKHNKMLE